MNSRLYLTITLLVYFIVVGGSLVWLGLPKKEEIAKKEPKIEIISEEVFNSPIITKIRGFTQFGNLPVTIDSGQQAKNNPFEP